MSLSFKKYSSMTKWNFLLSYIFICDFINSLERLTALDWVLDQSEYVIFLCMGLNNEQPSPLCDVTEGEVKIETDELFDV